MLPSLSIASCIVSSNVARCSRLAFFISPPPFMASAKQCCSRRAICLSGMLHMHGAHLQVQLGHKCQHKLRMSCHCTASSYIWRHVTTPILPGKRRLHFYKPSAALRWPCMELPKYGHGLIAGTQLWASPLLSVTT